MPSKRKKMRQEKQKKRGGEKVKVESQNLAFCAHPIFQRRHLASWSEVCEVLVIQVMFWLFIASQSPENGLIVEWMNEWMNEWVKEHDPKGQVTAALGNDSLSFFSLTVLHLFLLPRTLSKKHIPSVSLFRLRWDIKSLQYSCHLMG